MKGQKYPQTPIWLLSQAKLQFESPHSSLLLSSRLPRLPQRKRAILSRIFSSCLRCTYPLSSTSAGWKKRRSREKPLWIGSGVRFHPHTVSFPKKHMKSEHAGKSPVAAPSQTLPLVYPGQQPPPDLAVRSPSKLLGKPGQQIHKASNWPPWVAFLKEERQAMNE